LTENTRKNIHDYHIVLPRKYFAYCLEKQVVLADGTTEGPGGVYFPQEMPSMEDFIQETRAYFDKFVHMKNGKIVSGVSIGTPIEDENGNKIIDMQVVYHKKYQPYPVPFTREQELEINLITANRRATQAEMILQEHNSIKNAEAERFAKLERAFRKMAMDAYTKEEPKDCPVCLDPIAVENLHITLCGHHICSLCNSKCSRCPLCRDEY